MLYQGHYHPGINVIAGLRFAKSTIEWKAKTLRRSGGRNKAGGMGGVLISWYCLKSKTEGKGERQEMLVKGDSQPLQPPPEHAGGNKPGGWWCYTG